LPFPVQDSNLQYSVEIEKNKADEKYTEEIREYYDGKNISENLGTTPFFFSKMANGSLHIESLLTIIGKTSSTQVIIKI